MAQTLSVLVENKSGVLARIVGVFSARGFNIESLTVARTPDPGLSRITMVVDVEDKTREQVLKQLNKQVNVVHVLDFSKMPSVQRELALIKVHVPQEQRSLLLQEAEIFRARVVDTHPCQHYAGSDRRRRKAASAAASSGALRARGHGAQRRGGVAARLRPR